MKKQSTYLYERRYMEAGEEAEISQEQAEYWEAVLGKRVFEMLADQDGQIRSYLCGMDYSTEEQENGRLERYLREEADYDRIYHKEEAGGGCRDKAEAELFFPKFYMPLCAYAVIRLREELKEDVRYITDTVWKQFERQTAQWLQQVSMRTLIVEMHVYKESGRIRQGTPEQEYQYFCGECVGDRNFFLRLMETYPVLVRCIEERINSSACFYAELIRYFKRDRTQMQEVFAGESGINMITDIQGVSSDLHNNGRQVLKVTLDSGLELLYKPHSMDNECRYQKLLEWISERTGIEQYSYAFLSFDDHSWCGIVSYESCRTEMELHRYYRRLGSQLFLIYLLGTKDLHSENVIAHGEYPVLIDLETLVHIQYNQKRDTVFQEICYQLANSVLYTGLLPFYYFSQGGGGVNASAVSGVEGQKYPFKIPAVIHPGTSDMKIGYRYPVSGSAQNLAMLQGGFISPAVFGEDIVSGFQDTYRAVMENRELFGKELEKLKNSASRYLVQDTQRYSMLLSTSCHPGFLMDGAGRELFLHSLWKGRMEERQEIIDSEIKPLLDGDIPYFYYHLNDTALMTKDGTCIRNYFNRVPLELVFEKLELLGHEDLQKQCRYIRMSLELMPDNGERFENRCYKTERSGGGPEDRAYSRQLQETVRALTGKLIKYAVWNQAHTEVSWFTVQLSAFGRPGWEVKPMNMYLYDGLAGMLLIFYELKKREKALEEYYDTIRRMLFRYTDFMYGESGRNMIRDTGMYEGEASILYAYCLMAEYGGGDEYLAYARKQAAVVERLLVYDQKSDILAGNAGAALVLVFLYELTGDERYLQSAEYAVELLEKKAVRAEHGIGWIVDKEFPPFAGMAHGNSGVMMPAAALWKHTGKEKYRRLMEELMEYEEALFDEKLQNWTDIRGSIPGDEHGAAAWCHGAGGILLSRVFCYERMDDGDMKKRLRRDIITAGRKLEEYWRRDSFSLCHGSCGNAWILELAGKAVEQSGGKAGIPEIPAGWEQISFLPQEKLNPGLMNGYGGVLLYFILHMKNV